MKEFRARIATDHPQIHKYVFSDLTKSEEYKVLATRYEELDNARREKGSLSEEEKREMKDIIAKITSYKDEQKGKIKLYLLDIAPETRKFLRPC